MNDLTQPIADLVEEGRAALSHAVGVSPAAQRTLRETPPTLRATSVA